MSAESPTPESAALDLAIDPTLISLDAVIAAIRSWQQQADAQINTLLQENKELTNEIEQLRAGVPSVTRSDIPTASEVRVGSASADSVRREV